MCCSTKTDVSRRRSSRRHERGSVACDRRHGDENERHAQACILYHARHHEQLHDDAKPIDPLKVARLELTDVDGRGDAEGVRRCGRARDEHAVEHVVPGLGHHVQDEDHDGEHEEISVSGDEREWVALSKGLVHRLRRARLSEPGLAPMHGEREPQARHQDRRGDEHEKEW